MNKTEKMRKMPFVVTVALTVLGSYMASIPEIKWIGILTSLIFGCASIYAGKYAFETRITVDRVLMFN